MLTCPSCREDPREVDAGAGAPPSMAARWRMEGRVLLRCRCGLVRVAWRPAGPSGGRPSGYFRVSARLRSGPVREAGSPRWLERTAWSDGRSGLHATGDWDEGTRTVPVAPVAEGLVPDAGDGLVDGLRRIAGDAWDVRAVLSS